MSSSPPQTAPKDASDGKTPEEPKTSSPTTAPTSDANQKTPFEAAPIWSVLFFSWATPLFRKGYQTALTIGDIWPLRTTDKAESRAKLLQDAWDEEQKKHPEDPQFYRALRKVWLRQYLIVVLFWAGWISFALISSGFLFRRLLNWFSNQDDPKGVAYIVAACVGLAELCKQVSLGQMWHRSVIAGIQMRSAAQALVYSKTLRLRDSNMDVASVVTLVVNDCQRLLDMGTYMMFAIFSPATTVIVIAVLLTIMGVPILAGLAVMCIMIPIQKTIGSKIGVIRRQAIPLTKQRTGLMNELLAGIRLVKLYAWEGPFADAINKIRLDETGRIRTAGYVRTINTAVIYSAPIAVTLATFGVFVWMTGDALTASDAFVTVALFNVLRFPLAVLPQATRTLSEGTIAAKRIGAFLRRPELRQSDATRELEDGEMPGVAISVDKASFQWPSDSATAPQETPGTATDTGAGKDPTPPAITDGGADKLTDISFNVRQGELVAIVGTVGSGKSSLLNAILGQMERETGLCSSRGSIGYGAQNPWIFNDTLRNNVLFGKPYDRRKYDKATKAAALGPDIAQLPAGDQTEIGERGINLSGGQKARVALARLIYADTDIVLMDDPLSAVDVHVGSHIWKECVTGVMKTKTRVLVTHQVQYLQYCDRVIVLEAGKVLAIGTEAELHSQGIDFRNLVADTDSQSVSTVEGGDTPKATAGDEFKAELPPVPAPVGRASSVASQSSAVRARLRAASQSMGVSSYPLPGGPGSPVPRARSSSVQSSHAGSTVAGALSQASTKPGTPVLTPGEKLITAEDRVVGSVSFGTIGKYFKAMGGWLPAIVVAGLSVISIVLRFSVDVWLSRWIEQASDDEDEVQAQKAAIAAAGGDPSTVDDDIAQGFYIRGYALLLVILTIVNFIRGLFFANKTIKASRSLHDTVFRRVIAAKQSWYDTVPAGRILNRFTGDLDLCDVRLPEALELTIQLGLLCLLSFVLIAIVSPFFLVAVPFLIGLILYTARYFRRNVRELRRIEGIARSPLVSHIQASVQGLVTIRAFRRDDQYSLVAKDHINRTAAAYFAFFTCNRWVGVRLDSVVVVVVAGTALLAVAASNTIEPGLAGLSIVYAMNLGGLLQFATRQASEAEGMLTSVERLLAPVPVESTLWKAPAADADSDDEAEDGKADEEGKEEDDVVEIDDVKPAVSLPVTEASVDASWPSSGKVEFKNVSTRYRDGLPLVLRNINFRVQPHQRIGIIGRTGSGKSTSGLALFRVLELAQGSIFIDDVDVGTVPLHTLRSRLSIIPQDPVLFQGTVRSNLDPFNTHTDDQIWESLDHVDLAEYVRSSPEGLAKPVREGGDNFSVGQRQLLCLARALLKHAKVVLLDEATASVDHTTDATVQKALRQHLSDCTLLIIAHRLDTIMDCDKVLGLSRGTVVEFASPDVLLGLVEETEDGDVAGAGLLKSLVEETGEETAAFLKDMAREAGRVRRGGDVEKK